MAPIDKAELERRFLYHAPTEETRELHDMIREEELRHALRLRSLLDFEQPNIEESREISLMFTALEEASFWAHAHVARNRQ